MSENRPKQAATGRSSRSTKSGARATRNTTSARKPKAEQSVARALGRNVVVAVSLLVIVLFVANILLAIITRHGSNKDVPNFVGSNLEQAEGLARKGRLQIIVNDSLYVPMYAGGVILEQRPSAGKDKVKSGRKIYVTINASKQKSVEVPYVAGYSLRQAKSNLLAAGLEIDQLEYVSDLANNYVLDQKFRGEVMKADSAVLAPIGSKITLVVGRSDNHTEPVPDLTGMTLREAKNMLWDHGFNLGEVEFEGALDMAAQNAARVYKQHPLPETEGRMGRSVSLWLKEIEQ
ncbi:MAG: PASTA domain-containing protein [Tidjanibacter sp.]|nr:PASTA domain-containing protein [Tidjanibacter sp.]